MEAKANNQTYWLPLEPESVRGINQSPILLVVSVFAPEVFVLISYLALCWLCFSTYIDAHSQHLNQRVSRVDGSLVFRCIVTILLLMQVLFVTLYLADVFSAMTILVELSTIELAFPICVIVLILYYQCKFSGIP